MKIERIVVEFSFGDDDSEEKRRAVSEGLQEFLRFILPQLVDAYAQEFDTQQNVC